MVLLFHLCFAFFTPLLIFTNIVLELLSSSVHACVLSIHTSSLHHYLHLIQKKQRCAYKSSSGTLCVAVSTTSTPSIHVQQGHNAATPYKKRPSWSVMHAISIRNAAEPLLRTGVIPDITTTIRTPGISAVDGKALLRGERKPFLVADMGTCPGSSSSAIGLLQP